MGQVTAGTGPAIPAARAARAQRRDASERGRLILRTARELFRDRGVDATSMHEIARAAGVGQGSLYRRYAHKGELCAALLRDSFESFRRDVDALLGAEGEPALPRLGSLIGALARFNEENGPLLGAMDDAACAGRRASLYESPVYQTLRGAVAGLLRQARDRGETRSLDVECLADAVLSPLSIDLYLYQRRVLGYTPERILSAVQELVFAGLAKR